MPRNGRGRRKAATPPSQDGFGTIRLPQPLCDKLDAIVAADATYRSRSDLAKYWIMRKLEERDARR